LKRLADILHQEHGIPPIWSEFLSNQVKVEMEHARFLEGKFQVAESDVSSGYGFGHDFKITDHLGITRSFDPTEVTSWIRL
jgi:hypothetical protein